MDRTAHSTMSRDAMERLNYNRLRAIAMPLPNLEMTLALHERSLCAAPRLSNSCTNALHWLSPSPCVMNSLPAPCSSLNLCTEVSSREIVGISGLKRK
mmetsp:Transcript_46402/g.115078  ORF Transcript_46402/g.115078 Transcript_46402/m.115078 type:complete len:98 (-) Transcript_46402:447-740(-)